jgi:hypothetical protein
MVKVVASKYPMTLVTGYYRTVLGAEYARLGVKNVLQERNDGG